MTVRKIILVVGLVLSLWTVGLVVYKSFGMSVTDVHGIISRSVKQFRQDRKLAVDLVSSLPVSQEHPNQKKHLDVVGVSPQSPVGVPQEHHTLVVMIMSAFANQDRRNAIRSTWMNSYVDSKKKFYLKFVIGALQLDSSQVDMLLAEEALNHDILILNNHYDAYNTLTMKVLQSLTWINDNLNYSYVLKSDDDCFARLDLIEEELTRRSSEKGLYWGRFADNHFPLQSGQWKEDRWFLCDKYLPYALGGGYILSADVVRKISLLSDMMMIYNNEDVSVGAWTSALEIERKHDFRFQTYCPHNVLCPCDNRLLLKTIHENRGTVETMYKMDKRLKTNQSICEQEQRRKEFCYNWKSLPSKCCVETCT